MSTFEAFILGLLQGLTEFLPISSSAHLKIAKHLFGIETSETQVLFDLICHCGTLLAILYFLRKEIISLFFIERKKLFLLVVATLPLIPCYFLLKPLREFASQPHFLGICLLFTSFILFLGQKMRVPLHSHQKLKDVLWIGTMQSAALIPGISRSASTISCARVLGWDMKDAVRFSFLLSIPTVIGGNALELLKLYLSEHSITPAHFKIYYVGFFSSLICGLLVIRFAIAFLEKGNLKPFAWYCLGLGILVTFFFGGRS